MAKKSAHYDDDDNEDTEIELLPAIAPPQHVLASCEPKLLKPDTPEEQVVLEDLKAVNLSAMGLHLAWKSVTSVQEVCQLLAATGKLIEFRRKVLGKQYGPKNQITDGKGFVYPID